MVAGFVLAMGAQLDLKGQVNLGWGCADSLLPLGADFSSLEERSRGRGQLSRVSEGRLVLSRRVAVGRVCVFTLG